MAGLLDDVRLALKRLRHQPGFVAVAVLTLALGLGANTAMFTLVRAVMMQALPIDRPETLYRLGDQPNCCINSGLQDDYSLFSYPFYQRARTQLTEFSSLAALQAGLAPVALRVPGGRPAVAIPAEIVSGNYFNTLGVRPASGRLLTEADDAPGAQPVFVLSHAAWTQQFGADQSLVGKTVMVNGIPMTLVGITAAGFFGDTVRPDPASVWIPLGQEPTLRGPASLFKRPSQDWLYVVGRLTPGATTERASAHATAELRQFLTTESLVPDAVRDRITKQSITVVAVPGGIQVLNQTFGQPLMVLFAMSGLVLLIASANLANLLLARANHGEAALRSALGASSGRLIRQALAEGIVLSLAGSAMALVVAMFATRTMVALAFPQAQFVPITTTPSLTVLAFSVLLGIVTGVLFTVAPAWAASRTQAGDVLRGIGRSGGDRSFVPRRSLVIVQVALSLVLLTGAGLLGQSLSQLESQPLGFETDRRVIMFVSPPAGVTARDPLSQMYTRLRENVARVPGIESVSYSLYSPMEGNNWSSLISIEGRHADPNNPDSSSWNRVGPAYFETIGTHVRKGRDLRDSDADGQRVTVVNEAFVKLFLTDLEPIGRHVGIGDASHAGDFEIVGVVEDVKYTGATRPARPMMFLPSFQQVTYKDASDASVQLRSMQLRTIELRLAPGAALPEQQLRQAVAETNQDLTVLRFRAMTDQVSANFRLNRLLSRLTSAYGLLALALATLGLYGVTAYSVARRRREIGVRLALGATPGRVVRQVLGGTMIHTVIGLAIGVPAVIFGAKTLETMLFGVAPRDPKIIGLAAVVLLVSAGLAAAIPARRAASVDPTEAIRTE